MLSDTSSSVMRVILRVYFVVTILLVCIVGQQCCRSIVKLRLLQKRPINVIRMTGWVRSLDLFTIITRTKRIPGGAILGLGMVLATILAPVGDFLVSGLVKGVQVPGECQFGQGMVISTSTDNRLNLVPVNGRPYTVTANAQANSLRNGGLVGIYKKVNNDVNFRARPIDVIGGWNCKQYGQDVTYPAGSNVLSAVDDLVQRGNIYPYGNPEFSGSVTKWSHFVAVSFSTPAFADSSQTFRIAVDQTANNTDDQVVRTYECKINTNSLDNILYAINYTSTITEWILTMQGAVFQGSGTPAADNSSAIYETVLNSLVMVAGGRNYLLQSPPASDNIQGCLVTKTSMPVIVITFAVLSGTIFLATVIYWIILEIRIHFARSQRPDLAKDIFKNLPDGLLTWILQAARERTHTSVYGMTSPGYTPFNVGEKLRPSELSKWNFVVDGNTMRLEKETEPAAQVMMAPDAQFMNAPTYAYESPIPKQQAYMGETNEIYPQ